MAGQLLTTLADAEAWLGLTAGNTPVDAKVKSLIAGCSASILGHLARPTLGARTVAEIRDGTGTPAMMLRSWPVSAVSSVIIGQRTIPAAGAPGGGQAFGYVCEAWDGFPPGRRSTLRLRGDRFPSGAGNVAVTYTAGYSISAEPNKVQQAPESGPFEASVAAPYGAWSDDIGVTYATGETLTAVPSNPAAGQYSLGSTPGLYVFNTADNDAAILISYSFVPAAIGEACCQWVAERFRYQDRVGSRSKSLAGEVVAFDRSPIPPELLPILQPYRSVAPV